MVLGAAALYGLALAVLTRPVVESRLRGKIVSGLEARAGAVSLGEDVGVDALLRVSFGPLVVPPADRRAEPIVRVGRVRVRPALGALLLGRVEPASIELRDVRIAPGPGGRDLQALLARGARGDGRAGGHAPAPPRVAVRDLVVSVPVGSRLVELGPLDADLSLSHERGGARVEAEVRLPGRGRVRLSALRSVVGWTGQLRARGLGPDAVPAALRGGAVRLAGGTASIEAEGEAAPDLARARVHVRALVEGLLLAGDRVGAPAGPIDAEGDGTVEWDGASRRLALAGGSASVLGGALRISVAGEAGLGPGLPFALSARAEGVDYPRLAAALPPALAPPASAPRPTGTLDARVDLSGPLAEPAAWDFSASLDLSRMREAARRAPPVALREPFLHTPEGAAAPILVGPANPAFVPIAELPEHVVRAVTASEDAGFFAHEGFDFDELRNALAEGAEAGHVVRGGSTITQQLAKNLYLSPERTLARKIREAVVAIGLEASVPKRRLLEIYLNVAEWGPGIWGIGPAARHWFAKDARELTPKEAAFLASIIPNPVRYHAMFARGAPSDAWEEHVNALLLKMTEQGAISGDDLLRALAEPLVFSGG